MVLFWNGLLPVVLGNSTSGLQPLLLVLKARPCLSSLVSYIVAISLLILLCVVLAGHTFYQSQTFFFYSFQCLSQCVIRIFSSRIGLQLAMVCIILFTRNLVIVRNIWRILLPKECFVLKEDSGIWSRVPVPNQAL